MDSKKLNKATKNFITENSVERDALLTQDEFLRRYKISSKAFKLSGIRWSNLKKIHSDYLTNREFFENTEKSIVSKFLTNDAKDAGVHSVRSRLKNPDSLIEKIIRKIIEAKKKGIDKKITPKNYTREIEDILGIRILHVFKNDWFGIHNFILNILNDSNYKSKDIPIVYFRKGDEKSFVDSCKRNGCVAKPHPKGYRSIHYIIDPYPQRKYGSVEIQVRTVFEDGWSEIDHKLRYFTKKGSRHPLDNYLLALNRIAGSADEIGTLIKNRQAELGQKEYVSQQKKKRGNK